MDDFEEQIKAKYLAITVFKVLLEIHHNEKRHRPPFNSLSSTQYERKYAYNQPEKFPCEELENHSRFIFNFFSLCKAQHQL